MAGVLTEEGLSLAKAVLEGVAAVVEGVVAGEAGACAVVLLAAHPAVSATAAMAVVIPRRMRRMGVPSRN
ncbi:hypothetical protein [Streptomyces sp. MUSC 125]|uniref:hypothetical protein n=1 Tax=Streptomyces sp. MUSC 125 TaxID=1428624 RepID=UPI000B0EC981|nr:hypothetical protein [Streptomyces sp. MUSC 125]